MTDDDGAGGRERAGADLPTLLSHLDLPEHGTGVRAARRAERAERVGRDGGDGGRAQPAVELSGADEPSGRMRHPSRGWMTGFVVGLSLCVVAGALLVSFGVDTLRSSNAGRRVASLDPTEPGFEGLLEPTPTMLLLHEQDGQLISAALLALGNDGAGGSVLLLPPSVEVGDGDDAVPLSVTFAFDRTPEVLRGAGEAIAGVGVQELVVVDDERWEQLVAPVAPLELTSPDELDDFDLGELQLSASEVGAWLAATRRGENELSRLYRHQLFWQAWVDAIASSGDQAAVPGELDSGIGRFARGLAAGPLRIATVPVEEIEQDQGGVTYEVDRVALGPVIAELVPFPTGTALAPRTRVRLLDGTGRAEHVRDLAPTVVGTDATIVVVGNAGSFDYETTEIRYHQPSQAAAAKRIRAALGTGTVIEDVRPIDSFDVTIVLGTDT